MPHVEDWETRYGLRADLIAGDETRDCRRASRNHLSDSFFTRLLTAASRMNFYFYMTLWKLTYGVMALSRLKEASATVRLS